jgi:ubiquinone/menaquinone biosynthesis C-methylase UbiE
MNAVTDKRPASEHAFDAAAPFYDSWFDLPLGQTVDALEKDLLYGLASLRPGERVLDMGTGTGHFAFDLAGHGLEVVAVELSPAMLAVARGQVPPSPGRGKVPPSPGRGKSLPARRPAATGSVHLVRGDAAALPLAPGAFELVLSVTALEFVADPQRALAEMWRAVRPGGRLVVAVLNALSPWAWARRRESQKQETPFSHAHFFTPWEFRRLLRALGPVTWSSSVFIGPHGTGERRAWRLERLGRAALRPFGALLVGRVVKWR